MYVYYAQYEATLTISGLICQLMTDTLLYYYFWWNEPNNHLIRNIRISYLCIAL
jgi:hypothetical protein